MLAVTGAFGQRNWRPTLPTCIVVVSTGVWDLPLKVVNEPHFPAREVGQMRPAAVPRWVERMQDDTAFVFKVVGRHSLGRFLFVCVQAWQR